jgi:ureidoglycolate hydrolase
MKDLKIRLKDYGEFDFAEYGRIVTVGERKPDGEGKDFLFWGNLEELQCGIVSIGIVESVPQEVLVCPSLEKHDGTTETLIPVDGDIILVLALSRTDNPESVDRESVRAVLVRQGDALTLLPSVWHYAPMVRGDHEVKTYVLFKKDTLAKDLSKVEYEREEQIRVEIVED